MKVCLAVTTMVVAAFAVPLGLVIQEMARDRAFSNAERHAAGMGPTLSITTDRAQLTRAVATSEAGGDGRMAVHLPAVGGKPPLEIGERRAGPHQVAAARKQGRARTASVPGGFALLQPFGLGSGEIAVVEIHVPESEVSNGVTTAWVMLAGVGVALIIGSVAVADRLGVRMVQPARRLVGAAHDLGEGKLGARVPEDGPTELRLAAVAFNSMADQVVQLLANERELAADLSHRLRTPLTVLRLNAASLGDGPAAEHTRTAVERLEHEVDTIIRTARDARPQTAVGVHTGPGAGCDAAEVIRERMEFWSVLAEDEGREARVAGVDTPVWLPVARADLVAVLDALLGNVFRHTREGTAFAVDVHSGEDAVIVLVSDAGGGIADPEAALARGSSGPAAGATGSTGLGLDIVRRLTESTGGDVRISRSVLGGTEVRLWIPRDARRSSLRGRGVARKGRGELRAQPRISRRRVCGMFWAGRAVPRAPDGAHTPPARRTAPPSGVANLWRPRSHP